MSEDNGNKYISTLKGKILRRVLLFLAVVISLGVILTLLIQVPAIQNYLRTEAQSFLENKLQRKVSIGHLQLEWLSRLGLDDVLILDEKQDTSISAGHLTVSIDMSLISLIEGKLAIHDIGLNDVTIKDIKYDQDSLSSLSYIIQKLFPPKSDNSKPSSSSINLDLENINFQNLRFNQSNIHAQNVIQVKDGAIHVHQIDLSKKIIDISDVTINSPEIYLTRLMPSEDTTGSFNLFGDTLINILIGNLDILHGHFRMAGWPANSIENTILKEVNDFKISLDSVRFNRNGLTLGIEEIKLINAENFGIHHLHAEKVSFNEHQLKLWGYQLDTKESHLADSITLSYKNLEEFKEFNDKVRFNIQFNNSYISMDELTQWIPSLAKNAFFTKYKNQTIQLEGNLGGTLNEFRSSRMSIKLEKAFDFDGRIDVSDITKPDELFLSMRINALNTHSSVIKDLVKGLSNLKNFDHLGDINFRGSFDGSFKDFVAYGVMKTDVGSSKMDMRLKTTNDIDQAKYSGEIELIDFNLGKWTGSTKLGVISLQATVTDGSGLRAESASAKFKSDIRKLEYNGYTYSNILFDGVLNRKLIDGTVTIKDENANLDFVGKIDFTSEIPAYDFEATIRKLDFHALKWTNQPVSISGNTDIALKGKSLEELAGQIKLEHFIIQKDSTMTLLENLVLNATTDQPGIQKLNLQSDWISGEISGKYTLKDIWPSLKNQLKVQFPDITKSLKLNEMRAVTSDSTIAQAFRYSFVFKDIRGISNLLGLKMSSAQPFKIEGELNEKTKYILTTWNIPDFQFRDLSITNAVGRMEAKGAIAFASSYIDSTINKNIHLPRIILTTDLSNNKLNFSIKTPKVGNVVNNVSLNGYIELIDSTYRLHFASSQLSFLDRNWDILPDNEIAFRPGFIQTKSLRFVSGDEKIEFTSVGNRGLKVEIANLSIDWANAFLNMKAWNFSGKINLKAEATDAFELQGIKVAGLIDSFFINKFYFGLLDINAYAPNVNQPVNISLSMLDGTKQLLGQGFYDINGNFSKGVKNNYQFKFVFKDYPLRIFEFLIDDIVDNTVGNIQGNLDISRLNDKPNFSGKIAIKDGGLKVNYLGTSYKVGTQTIQITNSMIDVTGVQLKDELGNDGTLSGGIVHDHFKGFSLNAGLNSNRFLILKTTKEQNPDYYGTLVGNINARFHGEFNAIDIDVQGITARPSFLNIPVSQATVITSERIVSYRPRTSVTESDTSKPKRLLASKGISVSIDLSVNKDAEIALIFDEKKGDILKGIGNGDLQMRFGRNGGITMYGNYEVDQGEYLFTLLGVVNKPFKIKQGGTIRWDGDPLGAQIDLEAEYKGLSSSLINLLPEYESTLGSAALRTQASVDLGMHLYGILFKPEISFSIDIPNLSGDLRSIVDNKLNLLKSDQNALNQQVLGLMVWGSFLPPNQLVASSGVLGSTINNLSQFISSQLSLLVENALKELVADNSVISGFDFDVNYYNNSNVVDINNATVFDEFNLNLAPKFFEDRLSVGVGANFVNSSLFDRLITPHFEVEYSITKDRQLKIRAYARKDEINQGQLKDRIGGGISWRKEFDSLKDFKKQLKDDLEQKPVLGPSLE